MKPERLNPNTHVWTDKQRKQSLKDKLRHMNSKRPHAKMQDTQMPRQFARASCLRLPGRFRNVLDIRRADKTPAYVQFRSGVIMRNPLPVELPK